MTDYQERYNRWWLHRRCRRANSDREFKLVTRVELVGPPSFFYGFVVLHYSDGTTENISPVYASKPRKTDVDVLEE